MKIVEVNPSIKALVDANDGYCPCLIPKTDDTKCMCKDFREQKSGLCHCGRFEKVADNHCRNCKYSHYYAQHGYICTNSDSEHISDFMDAEDWCEEFTEKE